MPSPANLAIYQGDDYLCIVTVSDGTANGPDLTGYSAQAQMRLGPADANPDVAWEIETEVELPNTINLTIPRGVTALMSGSYFWDLQLTAPDSTVATILAGSVNVTQEVTRE